MAKINFKTGIKLILSSAKLKLVKLTSVCPEARSSYVKGFASISEAPMLIRK